MEMKNKKGSAQMVFSVLEQFGDSTEDITSDFITAKIREEFNVEVDSQWVEHFMRGISSKLTAYVNIAIASGVSASMTAIMNSIALKNYFLRNRKKVTNILVKIKNKILSGGKLEGVLNKTILKGQSSNEIAIREMNDTMKSFMAYQNINTVANTSLNATKVFGSDSMRNSSLAEGDPIFTGNEKLLKAVLEFKATQKE